MIFQLYIFQNIYGENMLCIITHGIYFILYFIFFLLLSFSYLIFILHFLLQNTFISTYHILQFYIFFEFLKFSNYFVFQQMISNLFFKKQFFRDRFRIMIVF